MQEDSRSLRQNNLQVIALSTNGGVLMIYKQCYQSMLSIFFGGGEVVICNFLIFVLFGLGKMKQGQAGYKVKTL